MTFQVGQNVQISTKRPNGWNRKAWEPYGGILATVAQRVERTKGNREYLVLMQGGPLKGEHRWFKERELQDVVQEQEISASEIDKLLHHGWKASKH